MFDWLKPKRRQPLQVNVDDVEHLLAMQQQLSVMKQQRDSERAAAKIIRAFAAVLETSTDWILDVRKLPYPKEVIRSAFEQRIRFFEECCRQEPNEHTWKRDLELHRLLALSLFDFQTIDPEDEEFVRTANAGGLNESERILLRSKYFLRAREEDKLISWVNVVFS